MNKKCRVWNMNSSSTDTTPPPHHPYTICYDGSSADVFVVCVCVCFTTIYYNVLMRMSQWVEPCNACTQQNRRHHRQRRDTDFKYIKVQRKFYGARIFCEQRKIVLCVCVYTVLILLFCQQRLTLCYRARRRRRRRVVVNKHVADSWARKMRDKYYTAMARLLFMYNCTSTYNNNSSNRVLCGVYEWMHWLRTTSDAHAARIVCLTCCT